MVADRVAQLREGADQRLVLDARTAFVPARSFVLDLQAASDLTINGLCTLALNDSAVHFGSFKTPKVGSSATPNSSNVTITGGSTAGSDGAMTNNGTNTLVTLNASGAVTLPNNEATTSGGAIYVNGASSEVTIVGDHANLAITSNNSNEQGGAISTCNGTAGIAPSGSCANTLIDHNSSGR